MKKLERLLNLMAALLETPRPLTAEEIRERVPGYPEQKASFRRMFERDKDDLREMGVPLRLSPIETADTTVDAYRIRPDDYYLKDPGLEPDELAALHLALSAVQISGIEGSEAIWKLGGTPDPVAATRVAALPSQPHLAKLFSAVREHCQIRFRYRDEDRMVDPLRLAYQRGRWYLTGHDHSRGAERMFRLDRIDGPIDVGQQHSAIVTGSVNRGELRPWEFGGEDEVVARLLVDGDHAAWAVRYLGRDGIVEERRDGAVVLEVPVNNAEAFRGFVLTFLDHAEILEPPELRADMVAWLETQVDPLGGVA